MVPCSGKSVLSTSPFKFSVLWALLFVSFFFLDGKAQDGTENILIMWAGIYLLGSSATLLAVYVCHQWMHKRDPKNYVEMVAWVFLSASCFALGFFTGLWPVWFPLSIGAILCARRAVKYCA